ncbi:MAG: DUF3137 domain-containing protein [Campylobacteraceae bacterium]|jgi:hypothetical protein|nr:DUF3137 domain-containing protein [Campylobacteraceae bacterium]
MNKKSFEEFWGVYQQEIKLLSEDVELKRKYANIYIYINIILVFLTFSAFYLLRAYVNISIMVAMALMLVILKVITLREHKSQEIKEEFKNIIYTRITRFLFPNIYYSHDKNYELLRNMKNSMIFNEGIYELGSYFFGTINGVRADFGEITLYKEKRRGDKRGIIFKGLIISADFPKNILGFVRIYPRDLHSVFGFNDMFDSGEQITLDNPEFEKEFVVYGVDVVDIMYILSHSMMERLLDIKKTYPHDMFISIATNKIYIFVNYGSSIEPKLGKDLTSKAYLENSFNALNLLFVQMEYIVKTLKLDVSIWK